MAVLIASSSGTVKVSNGSAAIVRNGPQSSVVAVLAADLLALPLTRFNGRDVRLNKHSGSGLLIVVLGFET